MKISVKIKKIIIIFISLIFDVAMCQPMKVSACENNYDNEQSQASIRRYSISKSLYEFTKQIYVQDIYANQARIDEIYKNMNSSGAYRKNREYAQNKSQVFYAEEQRAGRHLLIAGIAHSQTDWIKDGLQVLDYAFITQEPSGRVLSGDENHSVTLFLAALSDAILTLEGSTYRKKFKVELNTLTKKFLACANYYSNKARLRDFHTSTSQYTQYTHRRYIQGVWFLTAWMFTDNPKYLKIAENAIQDGLAQQTATGINPEKGGFDVSYQLVSVNYGLFCLESLGDDHPLSPKLENMARRAVKSLDAFILPSGEIITQGSSRSDGQEITRSGKIKRANVMEMGWTLTKFGIIMHQIRYLDLARRIRRL